MLQIDNIDIYIQNPEIAKQLSFNLQKEEIKKEFPNAYFAREKESLEEYVFYLLHRFPIRMLKNHYIEDCIFFILNYENANFLSVTKELYPTIGKKYGKPFSSVERSIRGMIQSQYNYISEPLKEEIFPIVGEATPTNFFFLYHLAEYIKCHYYCDLGTEFTEIEKLVYLNNIKEENNALQILREEELKKIITRFLHAKLGQFRFIASKSQLLLVDLLVFFIKNNSDSLSEILSNKPMCKKWELINKEFLWQRVNTISFSIENAYQFIDKETYYEIFGDYELHRGATEYIKKIAAYLKEQENVRKLVIKK